MYAGITGKNWCLEHLTTKQLSWACNKAKRMSGAYKGQQNLCLLSVYNRQKFQKKNDLWEWKRRQNSSLNLWNVILTIIVLAKNYLILKWNLCFFKVMLSVYVCWLNMVLMGAHAVPRNLGHLRTLLRKVEDSMHYEHYLLPIYQ